jgi:predicted RNase H-like nuclease (RuvC/YqgF family)
MRRILFSLLFACAWLLAGRMAAAEIYHYVDNRGVIHYTNDLATIPEAYRQTAEASDEIRLSPEQTEAAAPGEKRDPPPRAGSAPSQEEPETGKTDDPDAYESLEGLQEKRRALLKEKEKLEHQYQGLTQQRDQLKASREKLETKKQIKSYNQQVKELNEKISDYQQTRDALEAEIEQFNNQLRSQGRASGK